MKKKIFQRLLSMVLVVGMMMPTVSAYGEIAKPQPLYDQPTVEIIDGEKVEWEVVDGSEIDGGTSGRKYYVQFVRKDGHYGPEMDQKPSDGRPYRTVPYPPDVRVVNQLVKDATTIKTTETYTVHETRSGVRQVQVTPARTVSVKKTRPIRVFDREETIIITPERHITKYRTVEKRVVDVAAHYKSVRVLVRSGYYRNDYTVDHDGVPIVKKVWVPARYRTENLYVPATYKNVTVRESYVETIPAVTYVKKYYKTIQEVYYEDEYRPAVYEDQHYTYTVPVQKTRTITTHVPAEYREVTITTNKDKYEYWYEPTERIASKTLLDAITLWHASGQTSTGYVHQGRMYDNSGALWTGIVQRNGNYYENGRLIDFEPGIYTSSQGKYKTLQEKISKESTGITVYDGHGNSSSGYYYNGKAHLSDGTFVPSGYYYNLGGSIYDANGNIDEDFEIDVYQSSNGKYLNSTDRKNQLVSEISGLSKGTVSGNNRLYEIYRDYPEVRSHVVAKGPFYYKENVTGKTEPYEFPKLVGSGHPVSLSSEVKYYEERKMTYWTSEGQERSGYYRNGKAVTEGLEALSPGDVYYHDEKYYLYGQTPVVISNFNPSIFKDFGGDYKNTNEIFAAIDSKHIDDIADNNWLANFYDQHENFRGLIEEKGPFTYYEESQGTFKEQRPRHIGSENTIRITHKEERDILLAESLEAIQAILDGNPKYINNIAINGTDDILKHNEESLNNKIVVAEIEGVDQIFIGVHEELYGQSTFRCTENQTNFLKYAKDEKYKGKITYSTYEYYKHKNYDLNQGFASFTFGLFKGTYQGVHDEVEDVAKVAKMATTDFASTAKKVFDFINNMMKFIINLPGNLANINITKEDLNEVADGMTQLTSALSGALDEMNLETLGKAVGYVIGTIVASNTIGKLNVSLQGGTGPIAKFLKVISFVSETVQKTIQTALTKIMNVVLKPFKAAGQVASNAGSKVLNVLKETGCFVAGTQVLTPDGYKSIEDFEIGDYVYSKNISTNTIEIKKVYQTFAGTKPDIYEIIVDDVVMEATEEHPFWVVSKGWVEAKDLVETDVLIHLDGSESKISSIKVYKTDGTKIYNISVKDNHNYFVTSDNILTHNLDCEKFKIVFETTGQMTDDVMDNLYLMVKRGEISDLEMDELLSREMSEVAREQMLKVKRRRLIEGAFDQNGVNTSKLDDILVDLRNNDLDAEELALLREKISQSNNGDLDDILKEVDDVIKGTGNLTSTLLKKSTCTQDELYNYLLKNSNADDAKKFLDDGIWPEGIQVPKSSAALNPDGSIDWSKAPEGGYTLKPDGTADKESFLPEMDTVIDRYGKSDGRYTSPVVDGNAYSYTERSLPYVEDLSSYHQYKVTGDFSRIEDYVNNCPDIELKNQIDALVTKYYDGDYSKLSVYKGTAAKVDGWGSGGAIQYEFPLTVEQLDKIGLLEKLN